METKGQNFWKLLYKVLGAVIGFLPFIPNTLYYIGMREGKVPVDYSDGVFIVLGFVFVFGAKNFGEWSNALGKTLVGKVGKGRDIDVRADDTTNPTKPGGPKT